MLGDRAYAGGRPLAQITSAVEDPGRG